MPSIFKNTIASLVGGLLGDSCGLEDFLLECTRECNSRYCRITPAQVALRKRIVVDICNCVSLFWEGTLDMDDRWCGEGLLKLEHWLDGAKGKRKTISSYVKRAMNIEVYNVRGSGVRNAYRLSVGMAAASKVGKEVKRAAVSPDPLNRLAKRRKVACVFAESTCRDMGKHHMWQYYCTMRPCFKHV